MLQYNRRKFLGKTLMASTAMATTLTESNAKHYPAKRSGENFTVLFQGDSITDGNRGRDDDPNHILGHGYAFNVASFLGAAHPDRNLAFINRGVSGDMIADLRQRWTTDAIAHKPNLVSILAGVNDIQRSIKGTLSYAEFESQFNELITETTKSLPGVIVVLGEPFILPVGMVTKDEAAWQETTAKIQRIIRTLADRHGLILLPYQTMFNQACKRAPASYWIWDGIHPTYAGHGLMAKLWLDIVGKNHRQVAL
jgi:lysophospholipase L1-like esterase